MRAAERDAEESYYESSLRCVIESIVHEMRGFLMEWDKVSCASFLFLSSIVQLFTDNRSVSAQYPEARHVLEPVAASIRDSADKVEEELKRTGAFVSFSRTLSIRFPPSIRSTLHDPLKGRIPEKQNSPSTIALPDVPLLVQARNALTYLQQGAVPALVEATAPMTWKEEEPLSAEAFEKALKAGKDGSAPLVCGE